MPWRQWLHDLRDPENHDRIIIRHDPMSGRYLRAQSRLFDLIRGAEAIAFDDYSQKYNDWIGTHFIARLVVWEKQVGWKFGVYAVFELAYDRSLRFISGALFAYYDGVGADGGERLRSLEKALELADKHGFAIIERGLT